MFKVEKKIASPSKSHCRVGKISPKNASEHLCTIKTDYKTAVLKKSNIDFA
jgi:hypothetical protein